MAIDSGDKRKSVINWIRRILPTPNNSIDAPDRGHVAGFYRGLIIVAKTISTSSDLLLKKLDNIVSTSSDLLIKKLDNVIPISSDLLLH